MSEAISEQDAGAQKQRDVEAAGAEASHWRAGPRRFESMAAAEQYINTDPAQHAGEVSATVFSDGTVELFLYY